MYIAYQEAAFSLTSHAQRELEAKLHRRYKRLQWIKTSKHVTLHAWRNHTTILMTLVLKYIPAILHPFHVSDCYRGVSNRLPQEKSLEISVKRGGMQSSETCSSHRLPLSRSTADHFNRTQDKTAVLFQI